MDVSSSLTSLRQTLGLVYKLILTLAAGSILAAIVSSYLHYKAVKDGVGAAERLVGQGRLAEADALSYRMAFGPETAWARCFPGYFRTYGQIRIRCLVRSGQTDAARDVAEAVRLHVDEPVMTDPVVAFLRSPLAWLSKMGTALVSNFTTGFSPIERPGLMSGYEVLFAELVAVRDAKTLEALSVDLARRFPNLPLGVYAKSASAEVDPVTFPTSALAGPEPLPVKRPPVTEPADRQPSSPPPEAVAAPVETPPEPEAPPPEAPASWGIVTNSRTQAVHPESGQPVRALKAGDVLVIEGTATLRKTTWLTGTLILNNRNVTNLAFKGEDLEIFKGAFNGVPPTVVALRSRLAEIAVEEAVLSAQEASDAMPQAPEEKAYRAAEDRMAAFQKTSRELQDKLEKAAGSERVAILDRLHLMKYEEQAIVRDLQKKKEVMDAMVRTTGRPRVESKLPALRQEKKAILKKLAESVS